MRRYSAQFPEGDLRKSPRNPWIMATSLACAASRTQAREPLVPRLIDQGLGPALYAIDRGRLRKCVPAVQGCSGDRDCGQLQDHLD